ncbi:hypothetical protein [Bradyrhizobium sp. RP6]|uniref:hypothetical protein n=1 Tax=Bradyrhizobium sp. RP6 TaxID=2489596 RepID=UPI000F54C578|nr:hypothetical protein [Bradyrhizobium sp. RP6]RQH12747.1 hypothetical protein EHH60_14775 [Bradyrhizobium sp. RP6]
MFGRKKRLHVLEAVTEARQYLNGSGAVALEKALCGADALITHRDVFEMRKRKFPGNWTLGCFHFVGSLRDGQCDLLVSFAMHLSPQFSDPEVRSLLDKGFEPSTSQRNPEAQIRALLDYTFNKDVGVKQTLRLENMPIPQTVLAQFGSDIQYLVSLGRKHRIYA